MVLLWLHRIMQHLSGEAMKGVANIAGVADAVEEDEHKGPYEIKTDATVLALGVAQNMALEEKLETICDKW